MTRLLLRQNALRKVFVVRVAAGALLGALLAGPGLLAAQVASAAAPVVVVSALGSQIHLVRERAPDDGSRTRHTRHVVREAGGPIDHAVFRGIDQALESAGRAAPTQFFALDIAPRELWRYRAGRDAPLDAVLAQLAELKGRETWGELWVVTPLRPGSLPRGWTRVRGAGALLNLPRPLPAPDEGAAVPTQGRWAWIGEGRLYAFATVWRVDPKTLEAVARATTFEEDAPTPSRILSGHLPARLLMDELVSLVEQSVQAATADALASPPMHNPYSAFQLPPAQVEETAQVCREITFQIADVVARRQERHDNSLYLDRDTKHSKALRDYIQLYFRAVYKGCPNTAHVCGDEDSKRGRLVEDLDVYDEIAARGVRDGFYERVKGLSPETKACEELNRDRASGAPQAP